MKILVTGGSGFLGTALCKYLLKTKVGKVFASFYSRQPQYGQPIYLDVTDTRSVDKAIETVRPELVIHTAYSMEPSLMEPIIVDGTRCLAEKLADARFVHISTDFVFDGWKGPYSEEDITQPTTQYGRNKLHAEQLVQRYRI